MDAVQTFIDEHYGRLPLAELGIPRALASLLLTPRFPASRHVIFLLFRAGAPAPVLAAKVARLAEASASLQQEASVLRAVQAARPGGLESVPRVIAFERLGGHPMLLETAIPGIHLKPAVVRRDPERYIALALDWLLALRQLTQTPAAEGWYERLATEPLDAFAQAFPLDDAERRLLDETAARVESLRGVVLDLSVEHGDLSHPNLLIRPQGGLGVVDWELARVDGLGVSDLFFFLSYVAFSREDANRTGQFEAAFQRAFFGQGAWAVPHVLSYAARAGLARELLTPLFVLTWARYTARLAQRLQAGEEGAAPLGADLAALLRANRYYALWRSSLGHADELGWLLT